MPIGLQAFVGRQDTPFNQAPSQNPSHGRNSPQPHPRLDKGRENLTERQRRAEMARLPVPSTTLKPEAYTNVRDLAASVASRPSSRQQEHHDERRGTFDDINTTISSLSTFSNDQQYVIMSTDYNYPDPSLLRGAGDEHFTEQYGNYLPHGRGLKPEMQWNHDNIMSEVRTARRAMEGRPPSTFMGLQDEEEQDYREEDEHDLDEVEDVEEADNIMTAAQTPTKVRHVKMLPLQKDIVISIAQASMPPPAAPKLAPTISRKASSIVAISEADIPPASIPMKRPTMELDYDTNSLQSLSYNILEQQKFDSDPRAPDPANSFSAHGSPLNLKQKLENLNRMQEINVRELFLSQSTQEWEETGFWFLAQFDDHLRQVMDARQERRKTALKFEMRIKRRQAAVVAKTQEVEKELTDLGTGSTELLKNRPIAMRSTMNTPMR